METANDVDEHMPDYVASRVTASLNSRQRAVNGSTVVLLGLAYQPNSADARHSPAISVAHRLIALEATSSRSTP